MDAYIYELCIYVYIYVCFFWEGAYGSTSRHKAPPVDKIHLHIAVPWMVRIHFEHAAAQVGCPFFCIPWEKWKMFSSKILFEEWKNAPQKIPQEQGFQSLHTEDYIFSSMVSVVLLSCRCARTHRPRVQKPCRWI